MQTEKEMASGSFTSGKIEVGFQEYARGDRERRVEIFNGERKSEIFYDPYVESMRKKWMKRSEN